MDNMELESTASDEGAPAAATVGSGEGSSATALLHAELLDLGADPVLRPRFETKPSRRQHIEMPPAPPGGNYSMRLMADASQLGDSCGEVIRSPRTWLRHLLGHDIYSRVLFAAASLFTKTYVMFVFSASSGNSLVGGEGWFRTRVGFIVITALFFWNLIFPLVTMFLMLQMIQEYALREWVYYRCMAFGVLLDFKEREGWARLFWKARIVWYIAASTITLYISSIVSHRNDLVAELGGNCTGLHFGTLDCTLADAAWNLGLAPLVVLGTFAWLIIAQVHRLRQFEAERLISLNKFVEAFSLSQERGSGGGKDAAVAHLDGLVVLDESAVRAHFAHTKLAAAHISHKSTKLPMWPLEPRRSYLESAAHAADEAGYLIDFATLGRCGFTEESYAEALSASGRPPRSWCIWPSPHHNTAYWTRGLSAQCFATSQDKAFFRSFQARARGIMLFVVLIMIAGAAETDLPVPSLYLPCTFPVPSLYLPCTFPYNQVQPRRTSSNAA